MQYDRRIRRSGDREHPEGTCVVRFPYLITLSLVPAEMDFRSRFPTGTGSVDQSGNTGTTVAVTGNGNHVWVGESHQNYVLEPYPFRRDDLDLSTLPLSQLLRPENEAVDFVYRTEELDQLTTWRDCQERVLISVTHGPGGQGKTRLATEFGRRSASTFTVLRARLREPGIDGHLTHGKRGDLRSRRILLVVDYADRWPTSQLMSLISQQVAADHETLRIMLLCRSNTWTSSLNYQLSRLNVPAFARIPAGTLGAVGRNPAEQQTLYESARDSFAKLRNMSRSDLVPAPDLFHKDATMPVLAIQMAALVHLDGDAGDADLPTDPNEVADYLLEREHAWWGRSFPGQHCTDPVIMARAVFLAVLVRGVPQPVAVAILMELDLAADRTSAQSIIDNHAGYYPPADSSQALAPLPPDRLSERFVANCIRRPAPHPRSDPVVGEWALPAVARLLSDWEVTLPFRPNVLAVLLEVSRRWPHVARQCLLPRLEEEPKLALEAGPAGLLALLEIQDVPTSVLGGVEQYLPEGRHAAYDIPAAQLALRIVKATWSDANPPKRVGMLLHLAGRFGNAGLHNDALKASQSAVQLARTLAIQDPDRYESDLAAALVRLAEALAEIGLSEKADPIITEAVNRLRRLRRGTPASYSRLLAEALNCHSEVLSSEGRHLDASLLSTEALAYSFIRDNDEDADAHSRRVATTLGRLAVELSVQGHRLTAQTHADEAVRRLEVLDQGQPDQFGPELADALVTRAGTLMRSEQWSAARSDLFQASTRYRRLSELNRDVFEPKLAEVFRMSSIVSVNLKDIPRAARDAGHATRILRRIHQRSPRHTVAFAEALVQHAVALLAMGLPEGLHLLERAAHDFEQQVRWDPQWYKVPLTLVRRALLTLTDAADALATPAVASGVTDDNAAIRFRDSPPPAEPYTEG